MQTYHVENFGCRATQADGAALEQQFQARGLAPASAHEAGIVVLNTCTVTSSADRDARAAIRRVQRQNPLAKIIVTGCYAQRAPQEIASLPGITAVVGNSHKQQLAALVLNEPVAKELPLNELVLDENFIDRDEISATSRSSAFVPLNALTSPSPKPEARLFVSDIFAHTQLQAAPVFDLGLHDLGLDALGLPDLENSASRDSASPAGPRQTDRTRPNLKIQDGCDNRCSFCIIPSVRGSSRSLRPEDVLREINALVGAGYGEVVISGINLGRWGRDLDPRSGVSDSPFEALLRSILDKTQLQKLRISSVEPMDWSRDLIALVASSPRIAKHAHVPLQSGSDSVLRRMHRKYRPWHYREKIESIRAAMPTAAIGADVMTGFPGETDAEFESTRRLIADLPFTYLHVFTYSARPGTAAAALPAQVPIPIARDRNQILRGLAAEKKSAFLRSLVGKTLDAITLGATHRSREGDFTEALTDNYQKLYLPGNHQANRWVTARIRASQDELLFGDLQPAN